MYGSAKNIFIVGITNNTSKINNENTLSRCWMCSKLEIKTPGLAFSDFIIAYCEFEQDAADLVTFTEEILKGSYIFCCV